MSRSRRESRCSKPSGNAGQDKPSGNAVQDKASGNAGQGERGAGGAAPGEVAKFSSAVWRGRFWVNRTQGLPYWHGNCYYSLFVWLA